MKFEIFAIRHETLNLIYFLFFPVFPYAHKKFSKSKQLAESIDDICNNIWNKKKQRPESHQTGDKQRPENDQTEDKQRPENDHTGDKRRPENDQTGDKQRPENDQTGDKQRPENDQTGDKQRPEYYQTGDKQRSDNEKAADKQSPENDQTGDKQRPKADQTRDKQRPENDQKGDKRRLKDGHLQGTIGPHENRSEAGKSSVSEGVSQAGCQPMIDTLSTYFCKLSSIFADPDPQDPYVCWALGSGSISARYGSGSFHFQTKKVSKTLIPTVL
jgi:hypothetical protein